MYNLFLDDFRRPLDCHYMPDSRFYFTSEWGIVRDYDQFCKEITRRFERGEWPSAISFDHDLGDCHYDHADIKDEDYEKFYVGLKEKTGLDCAKWLVEFCLEKGKDLPPDIRVHSQNPVGARNIKGFIDAFRRFKNSEKL